MQTTTRQPDDLEVMRALLESLVAGGRSSEAIEAALGMMSKLRAQNTDLMLRLAAMQRERNGRRSEKLDPAQLSLLLQQCQETVEVEPDEEETTSELPDGEVIDETPKRKARRRRVSKDLPREIVQHELDPADRACPGCGEVMSRIGEDVSEILELVPAHFRVQEHRRAKYACSGCKETVKTAPGPAKLIEKGLAGPTLLAHVVQSKYEDALPLQRLRKIYQRAGVDLSVSTMCDWVAAVAEQVRPIVERFWDSILESHVLQADATGLMVLDRDHPEHIRRGTMWCYVGDRKYAVFRYSPTGCGDDGLWTHLSGRKGYLQTDGANIFDRLHNGKRAQAIEVGCWAHARRKFYPLKDKDPRAAYPLDLIAKLYHVEHRADRQGLTPEARVALRNQRSKPILDRLQSWLVKTAAQEPPATVMPKACAYSVNQWRALTRFLEDGQITLDNNLCELQIRSLAIGRKNFLFAGSDTGAEHAAILYSLFRTCALLRIDAYTYLIDTLDKLADDWPANRIDELLPEHWAQARTITPAESGPK